MNMKINDFGSRFPVWRLHLSNVHRRASRAAKPTLPCLVLRVACLAAALAAALTARAQNATWTNAGSGLWTDAASWSPNAAPSNNPTVNITNAGSKTVTIDAATPAANLTITNLHLFSVGSATNTLYLSNNSTPLTVLGTLDAWGSSLILDNGYLMTSNAATLYVANVGTGSMTVSNGTWLGNQAYVATSSGSKGTLTLVGGTTSLKRVAVGNSAGSDGTILLKGGQFLTTNSTQFALGVSGAGAMTVSGGTWLGNSVTMGGAGGAVGTLTISGGSNVLSGSLSVGTAAGATGAVTMSGGYLSIPSVTIGANAGASAVAGSFLLSSGAVLEANSITASTIPVLGGTGTLTNLSGGILQFTTATPTITINNDGSLVVTNAVISYRNVNNANITNANVAKMTFQGDNTFVLNNSTNASLASYTFDTGVAPNYQALALMGTAPRWQSGVLTVEAGGGLLVSNAANAVVSALFTNLGSVRVVNSTVTWQSNVVISGSYLSDPSTNIFATNVMVTASGSLAGSNGDLFVFHRDFNNQSTNRADFNLVNAAVLFTNASSHTLNLTNSAALDWGGGSSVAPFATNFAIGTLSIALSNQVTLTGTKSGATTNALYVGWLDLSAWTTNAAGLTNTLQAALTLNDINLYYDPNDTRNAYLQDASYNIWGGGLLIPIPEPSTTGLMLGGALFSAWLLRRKRNEK